MGGVTPFVIKLYKWVDGVEKTRFLALHDYWMVSCELASKNWFQSEDISLKMTPNKPVNLYFEPH